jgi:hypothetical protein
MTREAWRSQLHLERDSNGGYAPKGAAVATVPARCTAIGDRAHKRHSSGGYGPMSVVTAAVPTRGTVNSVCARVGHSISSYTRLV